jgi:DNA-directed RNA polymerase specialized sigma24 family protein
MQASWDQVSVGDSRRESFSRFARDAEPRLRIALAAAVGQDLGSDATAEALAYGWEHWERIEPMENPIGYLYRVGRSHVRPPRRLVLPPVPVTFMPDVEPALPTALAKLTDRQRTVVVLVHGFDWKHEEVAALLGIDPPTVATHLRRALAKLRRHLKVRSHG